MAAETVIAFAPGRVNLIGEHTDYNDGLALPFAVEHGVTVCARLRAGAEICATATDHQGEQDRFAVEHPEPAKGWRAYARGVVAELSAAGLAVPGAELQIGADLPEGGGLSSSAALEVALCLALLGLAGIAPPPAAELARLCSRVERDWAGANSGLLDQLAVLLGEPGRALRIDFRSLQVHSVPLRLGDWTLTTLDSGQAHSLADSGYNTRREECERARTLLGLDSLRDARPQDLDGLPAPLDQRVRHVIEENARVTDAVGALERDDLPALGALLDASHTSLRDLYGASTDAVEATVVRCREAGAAGARMMGGGFGGSVLALFAPGRQPPPEAHPVTPSRGAHLRQGGGTRASVDGSKVRP